MGHAAGRRFLGIFVDPMAVQYEGLHQVFDHLQDAGATAIGITPHVGQPVAAGQGMRFPPLHMDGYARVVDRPLWGKRELYVELFNSWEPDLSLYGDSPYKPRSRSAPAGLDIRVPSAMIAEAHKRGMQAHIQIHPFVPPNVRSEDQPVYPDRTSPQPPQVAMNACLNSPAARAYALGLALDVVRSFSGVTSLFTDWAEFGAYRLEDHFTCLCGHCQRAAQSQGFDWEAIQRDVCALWQALHTLTPEKLAYAHSLRGNLSAILELLARYPGWLGFIQFKARTVVGFYRQLRQLLDEAGFGNVSLSARGWPPPWNRTSGMDYGALASVCGAVTPKLFTFDYSALPRWYGETLLSWNPDLPESLVLDTLVRWMDLEDDLSPRTLSCYRIPPPEEPHHVPLTLYRDRVEEVVRQVAGRTCCYPIAHPYLPDQQWEEMVSLMRDSSADGLWVHMYAYLSDRKLAILRDTWQRADDR